MNVQISEIKPTIVGNNGLAPLNEIDKSRPESKDNIVYWLRFERRGEKNTRINLQVMVNDKIDVIGGFEEIRIKDLAKRLVSKRSPVVQDIIHVFDLDILDGDMAARIRDICGQVQRKWEKNEFVESGESSVQQGIISNISEDERNAAYDFLETDWYETVVEQINVNHLGHHGEVRYLWNSLIQAWLPKLFKHLSALGESSAGKTDLLNETIKCYPPEYIFKRGEVSPTALRKVKDLKTAKVFYLQQREGLTGKARYHVQLMHNSDGGMEAEITNPDDPTQTITEKLPSMMFLCAQVYKTLEIQSATRNQFLFVHSDEEQRGNVMVNLYGEYDEIPQSLRREIGMIPEEKIDLIHNSVRLLRKDFEIILPFGRLFQRSLVKSQNRILRDAKSLRGDIKAHALAYQRQRDVMISPEGQAYLIANPDDLKFALTYCVPHVSKTYHNITPEQREVLDLIAEIIERKDEEKNPSTIWVTEHTTVATWEITDEAQERLDINRSSVYTRLKDLRDNTTAIRFREIVKGNTKFYAYWLPAEKDFGILNNEISDTDLEENYIQWLKRLPEGCQILKFTDYGEKITTPPPLDAGIAGIARTVESKEDSHE